MTSGAIDWSQEAQLDPKLEYQALLRSLKYTQGFSLLFVRCSPAEGERLIEQVKQDLPAETILDQQSSHSLSSKKKVVETLRLEEPVDNLYDIVATLPYVNEIDVLFISGIEKSLVEYIKPGYKGEGDYYNLDTIPRILGHLNLQRERFREDFNVCFVFLVPLFALKYFIRRAPDFFDWRSGAWEFGTDSDLIQRESSRILREGDFQKYLALSPQERTQKILEIQEILTDVHTSPSDHLDLFIQLGNLFIAEADYQSALSTYDQVLKLKPDHGWAWYNRGIVLRELGRYEEAISSYDQALKFKPDNDWAWNGRGLALHELGRYEEAISSYGQALKFKPDDDTVWYNRGLALRELGRYEEAISSHDQALKFKPDHDWAWNNRGIALHELGRDEEAISSYDQALKFKPDNDWAWYNRGIVLRELGRYEEAIFSCDQALKFKPDNDWAWCSRGLALHELGRYEEAISSHDQALKFKPDNDWAWNGRGLALHKLGRYEEAISSYDQALKFKPDDDTVWYNRALALRELGRYEEAIFSCDQALKFKPDHDWTWNNRGLALHKLGRYKEAISSYDQALTFKPDNTGIVYNKACCYALQGDVEAAIMHLSHTISLGSDKYREMAKTDSDFDTIRDHKAFQTLVFGSESS